ncbi:MAG: type II toxin-antitoxin system PemK/MazF family toxin, partial [Parvularculaceae bacterium]
RRVRLDVVTPRRFDVYLVSLDPAQGAEIRKTRPGVVVSPDEANDYLRAVLIAPMTSAIKRYPSRVRLKFQGRDGEVALDQMRALDKSRLVKRLGVVSDATASRITETLIEYFS